MSRMEHGVTSFRNSLEDCLKKIPLLLEGREDEIWGSPNKNFFQTVKALGIRRNNMLTPVGNYLREVYKQTIDIKRIFPVIRLQAVFYITEKDFKMPFLDILNFINENSQVNVEEIIEFLQSQNYDLGNNPIMTIHSYLSSFIKEYEEFEYDGYIRVENHNYSIKQDKIIFVKKLLNSHLYQMYKANQIDENFYREMYENYYLSDNIMNKIIFFRYGIENG